MSILQTKSINQKQTIFLIFFISFSLMMKQEV